MNNAFTIKIRDKNSYWHNNLVIEKDGAKYAVDNDKLGIIERYEITHLINSYNTFLTYSKNIRDVVYHKPLNLLYLEIINHNNILKKVEDMEYSVSVFDDAIDKLKKDIANKVISYIIGNKIILVEDTLKRKLKTLLRDIIKMEITK